MADELVLNFDLPSAAPASSRARSHKGGRWTDRAKERKRGQIEQRKAARGDAPSAHPASPHGTKRQRDDDGAADHDDRRPAKSKGPRPAGGPGGPAGGAPGGHRPQQEVGPGGKKQFVSSLFSREGLPELAPSTSSAPVAPAKPSNAPLTSAPAPPPAADDAAQVDDAPDPAPELTKLGLSRELVAGLAGKLGITGPTACQAGAIPRLVPSAGAKRKQRDFAHDAILRAQTGSGKTLTFLLPMVQDLLTLPPSLLRSATPSASSSSGPDRSIGTLALILAPTRELASQIHTVLESLLSSLPSSAPASAAQPFSISPRALTAGLLVGGANRTHEKRRLRKGCPIVVATPGRLLDHLKTTEAFRLAGEAARVKGPQGRPGNPNNAPLGARSGPGGGPGDARVGLRWLVVDECDRLMDLGFEEQMKGILEELERRNAASPKGPAREWGRRTILCSATASEGVDRLAGLALGNGGDGAAEGEMPVLGARDDVRVKEPVRKDLTALGGGGGGAKGDADEDEDDEGARDAAAATTNGDDGEATALALPTGFTPPSQLLHHFVVVPPKLRFVALVALLRKLLVRQQQSGKGSKILVFMSCTDAVDFWWSALGKMRMGSSSSDEAAALEQADEEREADSNDDESKRLVSTHPLLPAVPIYRLHGSLPLQTRLASLGAFSGKYKIAEGKRAGQDTDAGVLLCTSVAARGLDVKNVGCVVQVDAPTEVRLSFLAVVLLRALEREVLTASPSLFFALAGRRHRVRPPRRSHRSCRRAGHGLHVPPPDRDGLHVVPRVGH